MSSEKRFYDNPEVVMGVSSVVESSSAGIPSGLIADRVETKPITTAYCRALEVDGKLHVQMSGTWSLDEMRKIVAAMETLAAHDQMR